MNVKNIYKNYEKKFWELGNNLFAKPNEKQVVIMGVVSLCFAIILIPLMVFLLPENIEGVNGIWAWVTVFISSPVLFVIWRFRDQNVSQQIENARKDTNLKEFHKLAEWVSGVHLVEDKVTLKTKYEDGKIIEEIREFSHPPEKVSNLTYSKRDGAIGLQIAAIYNLLPFYRGEHGRDFEKPAFNLLKTAWASMQNEEVSKLTPLAIQENNNDLYLLVQRLWQKAQSPLGMALTQVMLADGGKHFLKHYELFPYICLAGMNFNLSGVDLEILQDNFRNAASEKKLNFLGSNLQGVRLSNINLMNADFSFANLYRADLANTNLSHIMYSMAIFDEAKISRAKISGDLLLNNFDSGQLLSADLLGSYIYYDNEFYQTNKDRLGSKGVIVCYPGGEISIKAKYKLTDKEFYITDNIDLQRTQEANKDNWEITQMQEYKEH